MTKIEVLDQLCDFLRDAVADLMLPVSVQKAGEVAGLRPAEIIKQSLPNISQGKKKAPYIIVQIISGADQSTSRRAYPVIVPGTLCFLHVLR